MARPLRLEFAGALYHVTSRGDGQEAIYHADGDRRMFLDLLGAVRERFNWTVHAYCLMTNHYHLLVETPNANLSKGMRQLNGVYTQHLRNQVFLGSEAFTESMRRRIPKDRDLRELPQARQRPPAKSLDDYVRENPERNDAIAAAYRSGGYTLWDIGDFFGLHYSRISKIIQAADSAPHKEKGKTLAS